MTLLGDLLAFLTLCGVVISVAGLLAVRVFAARAPAAPRCLPAVTILKPVCGDEALLQAAIESFCAQDYPVFQLVIGARDADDPALLVARRVQARFPECDISIVVDATAHGANAKVGNLINMLPAARHDVLVVADSDTHVRPDFLARVVAALQAPGCGLVTAVCAGDAAVPGVAARLGAEHISHLFLPGALIAVAAGRRDCLGGVMALRRETLVRLGGFEALADHLADDNVLGRLVRNLGLGVRLAQTVPVMNVQERGLRPLWQHELRWARTIGALAPWAFGGSVVQYPLFWAALLMVLSGFAQKPVLWFLATWVVRAAVAWGIDRALDGLRAREAPMPSALLLPVRDLLSVLEVIVSFWSDEVIWRGRRMIADSGVPTASAPAEPGLLAPAAVHPAELY